MAAKKPVTKRSERVGGLPPNRVREEYFERFREQARDDPISAVESHLRRWKEHPETAAGECLKEHLQRANLDPALQHSEELQRFVSLMRELMHAWLPGMSLEQIVQPLGHLLAQHGGGAPSRVDQNTVRKHHARLRSQGERNATSMTAERFGISTRRVRQILKE